MKEKLPNWKESKVVKCRNDSKYLFNTVQNFENMQVQSDHYNSI